MALGKNIKDKTLSTPGWRFCTRPTRRTVDSSTSPGGDLRYRVTSYTWQFWYFVKRNLSNVPYCTEAYTSVTFWWSTCAIKILIEWVGKTDESMGLEMEWLLLLFFLMRCFGCKGQKNTAPCGFNSRNGMECKVNIFICSAGMFVPCSPSWSWWSTWQSPQCLPFSPPSWR